MDALSSTPKSALEINPEPWGKGGGASLAGRGGLGDVALDVDAVDAALGSFLGGLVAADGAGGSRSTSMGVGAGEGARALFGLVDASAAAGASRGGGWEEGTGPLDGNSWDDGS